jgi:hypothetical protein
MDGESETHAPGQATSTDVGSESDKPPAAPSVPERAKLPPSLSGDAVVPGTPEATALFPVQDGSSAMSTRAAKNRPELTFVV